MELTELLKIIRQHWLAAVAAIVVVMAAGLAAALLPTPRYTAGATLLAQPDPEQIEFGQIQVVEFLMPSLETKVLSRSLEETVRGGLPADLRATSFDVGFANEPGTGVFEIEIESTDQDAVAPIADAFADGLLADQPVPDLLQVTVLDPASRPTAPSAPAKLMILIASAVLALIAAVLLPLLVHALRKRRASSEELRRRFGTSVLGELPRLRGRGATDGTAPALLTTIGGPATAEAFHRMRTNVELALLDQPRAIAVTSLHTGDGKSTVTATLGWSLASAGNHVTIIDADLRRPSLHKKLGEAFGPGLAEMRDTSASTAVRPTQQPNLTFVPAGTPDRHPAEIVTSTLPSLVDQLEGQGRVVLVDAPPLSGVAETNLIVAITKAVIIVVDARHYNEQALEQALYELHNTGAKVLGVVLNRAKLSRNQRRAYEHYSARPFDRPAVPAETAPD